METQKIIEGCTVLFDLSEVSFSKATHYEDNIVWIFEYQFYVVGPAA